MLKRPATRIILKHEDDIEEYIQMKELESEHENLSKCLRYGIVDNDYLISDEKMEDDSSGNNQDMDEALLYLNVPKTSLCRGRICRCVRCLGSNRVDSSRNEEPSSDEVQTNSNLSFSQQEESKDN